jgi:predicted anti-sigma-YlaC factor YlaD
MDCMKVRSLYTLFRDGSLDDLLKADVSEHIKKCEACKRLFDTLDRVTLVAGTFEKAKPEERMIERLVEQCESAPAGRWFFAPRWVIGYAIVLLFIAGFSFGLIRRVRIQKEMIAQKQKEQLIEREGKYIMDYGQFEKGQVIYSVPGAGNTIQVVETSY